MQRGMRDQAIIALEMLSTVEEMVKGFCRLMSVCLFMFVSQSVSVLYSTVSADLFNKHLT